MVFISVFIDDLILAQDLAELAHPQVLQIGSVMAAVSPSAVQSLVARISDQVEFLSEGSNATPGIIFLQTGLLGGIQCHLSLGTVDFGLKEQFRGCNGVHALKCGTNSH